MEITWQIWQKVLFWGGFTGSVLIFCVLVFFCIRKCKKVTNNKKELREVVVMVDKNMVNDKDQTSNLVNHKFQENNFLLFTKPFTTPNPNTTNTKDDENANKASLTSSFDSGIEKTFHKNSYLNERREWYHSCPDFGRSTITRSENGYIIIAQSRPIVIDGNDVGYIYGKGSFSTKGIQMVYKYFRSRGWTNKELIIFVKPPANITTEDENICKEFETLGVLEWTRGKSRPVSVTSEEDYKLLECAKKKGGIIITKNSFQDWYDCCPEFREVITRRLLKYSFVNDDVMFHTGKIHRDGKTLEEFLTF